MPLFFYEARRIPTLKPHKDVPREETVKPLDFKYSYKYVNILLNINKHNY